MKIIFDKYSATGNDFILLDNREGIYDAIERQSIQDLCHRRFGVGADGIMMVEKSVDADFKMKYFNADGSPARFCGNGARAFTHFAHHLMEEQSSERYTIETAGQIIKAEILHNEVNVEMPEVKDIDKIPLEEFGNFKGSIYANTGVPHAVFLADAIFDDYDLKTLYKELNNRSDLFKEGVNVSVMEVMDKNFIMLRTWERGLSEETYSCGTGAVAAALLVCKINGYQEKINVQVKGGKLRILLDKKYDKMILCGKAKKTFSGSTEMING